MLRATIRANEKSDADHEADKLRRELLSDGLAAPAIETVVSETRSLLRDLVERGRELKLLGSQMHVTRTLQGAGYRIELEFRVGDRRGLFERVMDRIRGR